METVSVPVVLPSPGGLGVHCIDGDINSDWVFDIATGKRRKDIVQLRLFVGVDPLDVEVEVIISNSVGDMKVKRLRGKDVSFSLRVDGV